MSAPPDFNTAVDASEHALDSGDPLALEAAWAALEAQLGGSGDLSLERTAQLACLLIDVGSALGQDGPIRNGHDLLANNWVPLVPIYGEAQLHYNIANACKSLYDLERRSRTWKFNLASAKPGLEAKSRYWRSLATIRCDQPTPEQLTNLANALNSCGRVVDALHYYDRVFQSHPDFGMAHLNRSQALLYLNRVSSSYSVKLLNEIYRSSNIARQSDALDARATESARELVHRMGEALREHGCEPGEDAHDILLTDEESKNHDAFWAWCLASSLTLSEHSLYCQCAASRRDDLSIMTSDGKLSEPKVPALELLLNRMKSEYCLSRALMYQSSTQHSDLKWNVDAFEGTYSELFEGEDVGIATEFLRTSFRLCFGILDRIARGICDLLGLAGDRESIYFDSFWRSPGKNGEARWAALNNRENPSLVALYGLARDLNERAGGEWSRFKRYRNLFEHELCLIRQDIPMEFPPWLSEKPPPSLTRQEMQNDALDMLRFTRAAIFYFAFFVRFEGRAPAEARDAQRMVFPKKTHGKG